MFHMFQRIVFLATGLLLVMSSQLWASPTGSIMGFVKDPSGALVPGVKITLTNTATSVQLTTITNESGGQPFPPQPPAPEFFFAAATRVRKGSIPHPLAGGGANTPAPISPGKARATQENRWERHATLG